MYHLNTQQNFYEHDVVSMEACDSVACSRGDNNMEHCAYHNPGPLEPEYQPQLLETRFQHKQEPTLPPRCGHIFKPGEDVYHCRDCSFNEMTVLCSRCFYGSACIDHQWRMDSYFPSSATIDSQLTNGRCDLSSPESVASCDCGDPRMFKILTDCNYHLPSEFRPVPNLHHCNYLFQKRDVMFHCRTCYSSSSNSGQKVQDGIDAWICKRCFDPGRHVDHQIEQSISRNEGHYCHCGNQAILRNVSQDLLSEGISLSLGFNCNDDHNRQNVLCAADINEGMFYYTCKVHMTFFVVFAVHTLLHSICGNTFFMNCSRVKQTSVESFARHAL